MKIKKKKKTLKKMHFTRLCCYYIDDSEKADGLVRMFLDVASLQDITFKTTRPKSAVVAAVVL